jgi:hypothetical protein
VGFSRRARARLRRSWKGVHPRAADGGGVAPPNRVGLIRRLLEAPGHAPIRINAQLLLPMFTVMAKLPPQVASTRSGGNGLVPGHVGTTRSMYTRGKWMGGHVLR